MTDRSHLLDIEGFNQLARCRDGYCLYNRNDIYIGQAIEKYGEFSKLEMDVLRLLCGPGDFVIEVGANIGAHTVELARHVGPQGTVLAFEPQRLVFQTLCANVALNSLANVHCYWSAAGDSETPINVPQLDPELRNNFGGLSIGLATQPGQQVECRVLDGFLSLPRLRLLKIDVEGMEESVIRGAQKLLAKFKPVLYVENDRLDKSESLMRLLDSLGYDLHWHRPPLFNPDNFYGVSENQYSKIVSINMIGVHRENPVVQIPLPKITDFTTHPLKKKRQADR